MAFAGATKILQESPPITQSCPGKKILDGKEWT